MSIVKAIKTNHISAMERKGWGYTYWAFDLHSTIIKPNYEAGNIPTEIYPFALECLKAISDSKEVKMIMYTCSHPHEQKEYLELFEKNNINFDFVNKNPEVKTEEGGYGYYSDKPYFNVLFEDKAGFDGNTDWVLVKELLIEMGFMKLKGEELITEFFTETSLGEITKANGLLYNGCMKAMLDRDYFLCNDIMSSVVNREYNIDLLVHVLDVMSYKNSELTGWDSFYNYCLEEFTKDKGEEEAIEMMESITAP
jgi:hypothetical protein